MIETKMRTSLTSLLLLVFSIFVNAINGSQFTITKATIDDAHCAFNENQLTSRQLVDLYLDQIAALNPQLRSVLEVNLDAQNQVEEADREREEAAKDHKCRSLGELHGIPILLKDSIGTKDKLNTTCGSYTLLGSTMARDAGVVQRLRRAGVVILGKSRAPIPYDTSIWDVQRGHANYLAQAL